MKEQTPSSSTSSGQKKCKAHVIESSDEEVEVMKDYILDHNFFFASI